MTTEGSALWFRAVTYSPVPHVQVQVANWLTEDKVRMTTSNCSSRFPGARIYKFSSALVTASMPNNVHTSRSVTLFDQYR